MKDFLIFDFDGTIANTLPIALEILEDIRKKYKFHITEEQIEDLRNYTIIQAFRKMGIPLYMLPQILRDTNHELHKYIDDLKPIEGMPEILMQLKNEEYHLAIVTSNSKENVQKFLDNNNLNIFEFIHSGTSIFGKDKTIKKLLKKHKISIDGALYVGDEIRDIQASKKINIPIISVTWGLNSKKGLCKYQPDYVIDNPIELKALLESV